MGEAFTGVNKLNKTGLMAVSWRKFGKKVYSMMTSSIGVVKTCNVIL